MDSTNNAAINAAVNATSKINIDRDIYMPGSIMRFNNVEEAQKTYAEHGVPWPVYDPSLPGKDWVDTEAHSAMLAVTDPNSDYTYFYASLDDHGKPVLSRLTITLGLATRVNLPAKIKAEPYVVEPTPAVFSGTDGQPVNPAELSTAAQAVKFLNEWIAAITASQPKDNPKPLPDFRCFDDASGPNMGSIQYSGVNQETGVPWSESRRRWVVTNSLGQTYTVGAELNAKYSDGVNYPRAMVLDANGAIIGWSPATKQPGQPEEMLPPPIRPPKEGEVLVYLPDRMPGSWYFAYRKEEISTEPAPVPVEVTMEMLLKQMNELGTLLAELIQMAKAGK